MKVFVCVEGVQQEGGHPEKVFDSEDKAKAWVKKQERTLKPSYEYAEYHEFEIE
jgi:hypothetical protein